MRHDPASGAIVIMLRSLKIHGMAQAVTDLIEHRVRPLLKLQFRYCLNCSKLSWPNERFVLLPTT